MRAVLKSVKFETQETPPRCSRTGIVIPEVKMWQLEEGLYFFSRFVISTKAELRACADNNADYDKRSVYSAFEEI